MEKEELIDIWGMGKENDLGENEEVEGLDIYESEGEGELVSDIGLQNLITVAETYKNILNKNNEGYNQELLKLFFCAKSYLQIVRKSEIDVKQKHIEEEMLLHKLVSKIGVLSNYFERDNYSAKTEDREVLGRMGIAFYMGKNCNLVPGCLPNLNKLTKLGIIDEDKIEINLGKGVNLQESVSFVKTTSGTLGNYASGKFENNDKLESIKIKTGNNCSLPHGSSFYPGKRNDINIECGDYVFFGINTLIGSGTNIGNNSTIWLSSQLGNNVSIGNNVLVGQTSTIESDTKIPDNCLIPNFSIISNNFETIAFEEYTKNPDFYKGNRNFIILLSEKEADRNKQLISINEHLHYNNIDRFNKHNVVPENKIIAEIDTMFNVLKESIGFEFTKIFKYDTNFDELKKRLGEKGIGEDLIDKLNFGVDGQSRVILKAFPKNVYEFLVEEMPIILNDIIEYIDNGTLEKKKDALLRKIESLIERPKIKEEDLEKQFFGDCYITGKFEYSGDCTFVDLKSRGDELRPSEKIIVEDSIFIRGTIHGGGDKTISGYKVFDLVAHGGVKYITTNPDNYTIGEIGKRSVLNNATVKNSTILGDATINGADIIDSNLSSEVSIAGGNGDERVIIEKSTIGKSVCINPGTRNYGKLIPDGMVYYTDIDN